MSTEIVSDLRMCRDHRRRLGRWLSSRTVAAMNTVHASGRVEGQPGWRDGLAGERAHSSYATSLRACRARTSLIRVWYPTRRRRASLRNCSRTPASTRIAISWRGSSPSGGRPTRRIAFSCSADESGMSEKSICRRVRRPLAAARSPRADDPDRFGIATSPECVRDHEHASTSRSTKPQEPRLRRRVLQVRAIERVGIQEDGHRVVERDAVLRRVGLSLPRVPLEH